MQMVGRAARHAHGAAIFYADRVTPAMQQCLEETARRRTAQIAYNDEHGLTPRGTKGSEIKSIFDIFREENSGSDLAESVAWTRKERGDGAQAGADAGGGAGGGGDGAEKGQGTTVRPTILPSLKELADVMPTKCGVYTFRASRDGAPL